ncbi:MAG: hypothetical protein JRI25_13325 [Deltaproteobacteria bacterium]|nr:hypothetical protein [Deltaproteobacteria bacterium]MBW2255565.1 hypothetical protein [Deltaproteobacteria bacterium]
MKRVVIVLLPLFLAAPTCGKKPVSTDWGSPDVQRWAPPPQVVEYDRINVAGPFSLPDVRIRDEWHGPVLDDEILRYDIHTYDITEEPPELLEIVRHFFGPGGYGYIGTLDEEGNLEIWDPPQVVLPASPSVGMSWSGTHQKGASTSVRSCEIMTSKFCEGGIVSVCESQRDGGRIILRDQFCPEVGWSGFEAMVLAGEKPPIRMWSEHVVRDGVALPEPELGEGPEAPPAPAPESEEETEAPD